MTSQSINQPIARRSTQGVWTSLFQLVSDLKRRRRFKRLLDLDDHMLRDIGLIREEVLWGTSLSIRDNASFLAHHKARIRRRQEGRIILNLPQ